MRFQISVIGALLFSQNLLSDCVSAATKKKEDPKTDDKDADKEEDEAKEVKVVVPVPVFAERRIQGALETLDLPLEKSIAREEATEKEERKKTRFEKMELTYWTTLVEPKKCIKDPFGCPLTEYLPVLEVDITLSNINVADWPPVYSPNLAGENKYSVKGNHLLEFRLAFDQWSQPGKQPMFDVLRIEYPWNLAKIEDKDGWKCIDGYANEPKADTTPNIQYEADSYKEGDKKLLGIDSFRTDLAQDCAIDQYRSSVTVDETNFATFKVHFQRALKTRGQLDDAELAIDEAINIEYMYKVWKVGNAKDKKNPTPHFEDHRPALSVISMKIQSFAKNLQMVGYVAAGLTLYSYL